MTSQTVLKCGFMKVVTERIFLLASLFFSVRLVILLICIFQNFVGYQYDLVKGLPKMHNN